MVDRISIVLYNGNNELFVMNYTKNTNNTENTLNTGE